MKDFYCQEVTGIRKLYWQKNNNRKTEKTGWFLQGHFPLGDGRGVSGTLAS